jgi:phospholipase/carboxylesterase
MPVEKATWGGLPSVVVHHLPAGSFPRLAVVLCHGYGAPGTDLVGLAQPLFALAPKLAESAVFIFPAARLDLVEQGIAGGRAWWPIDLDRLLNRRSPEYIDQFRRNTPAGLLESREMLLKLIDEAGRHFQLTSDRLVLGGFSQGGMLAVDVALRLTPPPSGLCILSGGLINEEEWRNLAKKASPLTVLQSHGRHDSILPLPMAEALRDLLLETGADLDFIQFNGDHEIPPPVLHRMAAFLTRLT